MGKGLVMGLAALAGLSIQALGHCDDASSRPSSLDDDQQPSMTLTVRAKRNRVENTAQVSQTEVTREQIKQTPRGQQISLPELLASTIPSAISAGYGRVFTRQDENGLQYQVDGIQLPDTADNAFGDVFNPRNIQKMEVILERSRPSTAIVPPES